MSRSQSLLKKRRRRSVIAFEMIRLDRSAAEPLHEQLYRQIRDELKSGTFADAASRLSWLAHDLRDWVAEIEMNPVIVRPDGCAAVDALFVSRRQTGSH